MKDRGCGVRCVVLGLVFSMMTCCATAHAVEYWPTGIDAVYTYANDAGDILEVTYDHFGNRTSHYSNQPDLTIVETYAVSSSGDVLLTHGSTYWSGAWDPEYYRYLGGAFTFVDLPLNEGATWFSYVDTECCYGACSVGYGFVDFPRFSRRLLGYNCT